MGRDAGTVARSAPAAPIEPCPAWGTMLHLFGDVADLLKKLAQILLGS